MRLSSLLLRAGVCLVLAAPAAFAQSYLSTELFVARNGALADGSLFGLGLTLSGGVLALRGSGAAAFSTRSTASGESVGVGAWTGEADLVLQPSIFGNLRAGAVFAPYVFGGVGRISAIDLDGFREQWTAASYGAGLLVPLGRALGITTEARYRLPLAEALDDTGSGGSFDSSFPRGWEYRFGLSIRLGG
jgi:hypothetical protein